MDVGLVRTLGSPDGQALLRSLPRYDEQSTIGLAERLRKQGHSPDLVAAFLTQQRLRERAVQKFGEFADALLYTPDGLEQASRLEVAAGHAGRFYNASLATVHDLGCGIGSDAVAMSALGVTVHGVDIDPVTAAIADINLRPWPDSRAREGMAEDFDPPRDPLRSRVGVWLDPARRVPGQTGRHGRIKRVFRLDEIRPSWQFVVQVATAVPATGAKLSPSMPHDAIPLGTEAQWTSYAGEVLECAVWWGPLAQDPGRSARILMPGRSPVEVTETMAESDPPMAAGPRSIGSWLYEPDRAVTQAGLLGAVTAATLGVEVERGLGYVLSEAGTDVPFARRYAVRESMPFSVKRLRSWLVQHGVTGLTIKKRGMRLDDDALRHQLKIGRGAGPGEQATVILTRVAGHQTAIIVDPVTPGHVLPDDI
ncbi:class I SAM-dependent methyltransferase [Phycicoccus sp. CSK15P-2]|uniref:class I SAM-dependent methyltransferase n=1 Tax=Phycicoccus sp. CSK15P-2 TaxID=2807627 RepID=UPI00194E40AB|nr:class I SAM-dependent methyltransferase [Phycicoccus sp. CSK15P-2]MBM6402772.1 class I SAM-dependent methyltransferase [Phycicoccus sp. CSK15P-2]